MSYTMFYTEIQEGELDYRDEQEEVMEQKANKGLEKVEQEAEELAREVKQGGKAGWGENDESAGKAGQDHPRAGHGGAEGQEEEAGHQAQLVQMIFLIPLPNIINH